MISELIEGYRIRKGTLIEDDCGVYYCLVPFSLAKCTDNSDTVTLSVCHQFYLLELWDFIQYYVLNRYCAGDRRC
jgi:hypothetical protein